MGLFTCDILPLFLSVVHRVTNQFHPSVLLLPHASHPSTIMENISLFCVIECVKLSVLLTRTFVYMYTKLCS
jgi:hypothetical protein